MAVILYHYTFNTPLLLNARVSPEHASRNRSSIWLMGKDISLERIGQAHSNWIMHADKKRTSGIIMG